MVLKKRISFYLIICLISSFKYAVAQLPVCDVVYGRYLTDQIAEYNPTLPISSGNPSINSIKLPIGSSGLALGPVLGSGSTVKTFYSIDLSTANYIYYNATSSSWANTGHKAGSGAVNIASGGGYIYNLEGPTGKVYQYDGTGNATLLTTVTGFSGALPYDLIADCEGNWYVFKQFGSGQFLRQYSASGVLLHSWVYANPLGLSVKAGAGFAIIDDTLYTDNTLSSGGSLATYSLGFDTVTLVSATSISLVMTNDFASCEAAAISVPRIEITASENDICFNNPILFTSKSLGGGASPVYRWFVNGSLVGSGVTFTYTPLSGDKVYCVLTSSSPCAITATDTSNMLLMNTPGPKVISPVHFCLGAPSAPLSAVGTGLKWYTTATGGMGSATAPTPNTSVAGTTLYYVSGYCPSPISETPRSVISVTVHPPPTITFSTSPSLSFALCSYGPLNIKASNPFAASWQWDSAGISIPGAIYDSLVINTTGKWGVSLRDVYGCQSYRDFDVLRDSSAKPVLSPVSSIKCNEGSVLLTCSPGFSSSRFEWLLDGLMVSAPTINLWNAYTAGNYSVRVTTALGCSDTSNVVSVSNFPAPLKPTINNLNPLLEIPAIYWYYQWYKDGIQIMGANSNRFYLSHNGNYHVEVTDANGCLNQSDTVFIENTTSIQTNASHSLIRIYPNPAKDLVYLESSEEIIVQLFDVFGKELLGGSKLKSIDLSNLSDGLYFIRIYTDEHQYLTTDRIIIAR